jgi:3-oxoacyl-(acyl-carrier-protein) synthase III
LYAIVGSGSYLPPNRFSNEDLVKAGVDTSDAWIVAKTGIRERRFACEDQASSDLAAAAGAAAIASAGLSADAIDLVVCATSSPDHLLPSTASIVQNKLGCSAGAFDLNAGCSGFPYALSVGFAMLQSGGYRHVLVVGADTYSRFLDPQDRTTYVFFGDGAGAVVLGPVPGEASLLATIHGSDGAGAKRICVPCGGSRLPATEARLKERLHRFRMDGRGVWDFVIQRVPKLVHEVTARAGLSLEDIDLIIFHQANRIMLRQLAELLRIPESKLFTNVERYANTAAASIPIALDEAVKSGRLNHGQHVLLVGFGAGLSWSALCLRWHGTSHARAVPDPLLACAPERASR